MTCTLTRPYAVGRQSGDDVLRAICGQPSVCASVRASDTDRPVDGEQTRNTQTSGRNFQPVFYNYTSVVVVFLACGREWDGVGC